jgi:hypothetical protein
MKPGGGANKGSAFERLVCGKLSLWVSGGARYDLFSRNKLSGGSFTIAADKGYELGLPGDVAAAHPDAFLFLSKFAVEAKHHRAIHLDKFLWDLTGHNFLARVWVQTKKQAEQVHVHPMIVAKQNNSPVVALLPIEIGRLALSHAFPLNVMTWHSLHKDTVMLLPFAQLMQYVRPARFLNAVAKREKPT